jgi:hypothetical protein
MQARRLRLGDILDDYCPRERRVTNHAVVAMIEDQVKQTRCTTCDAEHEYKAAKVPAVRRKKSDGVLAAESLAGGRPVLASAIPAPDAEPEHDEHLQVPSEPESLDTPEITDLPEESLAAIAVEGEEPEGDEGEREGDDDGPVHRRLIRATLPRPEGQVPERKEPDFTMRNPGGRFNSRNGRGQRGGRPMRAGQGPQGSGQHGSGQHGGPSRFGGPRQHGTGQGAQQGQRQGNRSGQNAGQQRGGGRPGGGGAGGQNRGGQGRKRGR